MPLHYNVIEIFTSEEARWNGRPVHSAVIEHVRKAKIAARCLVIKGIAGCYESGEVATGLIEVLSFNLPLKIEIILPSAELNVILPGIEEMVTDGIVVVEDMDIRSHRVQSRLIPRQLKVRDAMTPSPVAVSENTSVADIIRILLHSIYNALPVVDSLNRPIGIVTQGDLISRAGMPVHFGLLSRLEKKRTETYLKSISQKTAGEIMTRPVITVSGEKHLGTAVDLMLKNNLKRMPVTDRDGRLAGMLARFDIFKTITEESPDWGAFNVKTVRIADMRYVKDIMHRDIHVVSPDTSIIEIVRLIDASDIQRVAVVDGANRLLGVISDHDLLGVFAEHHAGVWDYLMAKMPIRELSKKHRELIRQTQMKNAADVMKTDLVTIRESARIDEAVKIMAVQGIKRLPVVDDDGKFKGMISRDSVLRAGINIS